MGRIICLKNNLLVEEIYFFKKVSSTMEVAKKIVLDCDKDKILVVAERQTSGRGRLSRPWMSPKGGLYMTFVLKVSLEQSFFLNYVFSLSLVEVLKKYKINASAKWPNDVLVEGKKIAGILIENFYEENSIKYSFVGVGVNLNISKLMFKKNNLDDIAISAKMILDKNISLKDFLSLFLKVLSKNYKMLQKNNFKKILTKWKKSSNFIGKEVKVVANEKVFYGIVENINNDGSLKLKTKQGVENIFYGDCILTRALS